MIGSEVPDINYFLTLIKHYFFSQFYNYMYTCYLEIIKWMKILGQGGGAHAPHAPSKSATGKIKLNYENCVPSKYGNIVSFITHRGGLSLSIIIWRIGGGAKFPFALGPKNSLLMCYVKKLYYYILHLLHLLLPGPPREFLGPKAKGNLAPPPILQIMILKLSPRYK
jgi:hypothetical protein